MKAFVTMAATLAAGIAIGGSASAHHSFAMFDPDQQILVRGTVTDWAFNSPHSWLFVELVSKDGETQTWGFESAAPFALTQRGINGATFKPGDEVTLVMRPLRDGRAGGTIGLAMTADGTVLDPSDGPGWSNSYIELWQEKGWLEEADWFQVSAEELRALAAE